MKNGVLDMKSFVYPAVLFEDKENNAYSIAIYDLSLFTSGDTVEEAHKNMADMLTEYFNMVEDFGFDYAEASPFNEMIERFPKQLVVLVEAKIK